MIYKDYGKPLKTSYTVIFILFWILTTGHGLGFSQSTQLTEWLKSAQSENDSIKSEALEQIHKLYVRRNPDSARIYLNELKILVKTTKEGVYKAAYNTSMGRHFLYQDKFDSAFYYYQLSVICNRRNDNLKKLGSNYLSIGFLWMKKKQADSSLFYYRKAENIFKDIHYSEGLSSVYNNLGALYSETIGDLSKSLEFKYKALSFSEESGNERTQTLILFNIGNTLISLDRPEEAEKEIKKGLVLAKQSGYEDYLGNGYDKLSYIFMKRRDFEKGWNYAKLAIAQAKKNGDLQTVFEDQDNLIAKCIAFYKWEEAFHLLNENLLLLPKLQVTETVTAYFKIKTHLKLAQYYFHIDNKHKASQQISLAELQTIPADMLDKTSYHNLLEQYESAYEKAGMFEKAMNYHLLRDSIESIFRSEKNNRIWSELEIKYETEKKEQEIINLQQASQIQLLQLQRQRNYLFGGGAFALLILLSGYVFYRQYKIKKEKDSLELEQRFLRSQLNPHFIFNSLGALQKYLFEQPREKVNEYLRIFSKLMRQILENSRMEFVPLSEEIDMLKNYLELQKIRFSEAFTYIIEIDESLDEDNMGIPPMFAQPFIENSLEHGLFRDKKKNEIVIRFLMQDKRSVKLEIEDSGIGLTETYVQAKQHHSLATKIVKERLEKMNAIIKAGAFFHSENIINESNGIEGYKIILTLPYRRVAA